MIRSEAFGCMPLPSARALAARAALRAPALDRVLRTVTRLPPRRAWHAGCGAAGARSQAHRSPLPRCASVADALAFRPPRAMRARDPCWRPAGAARATGGGGGRTDIPREAYAG